MARPTKQGIDYFPLDVDFDDNVEMYLLEKEAAGLAVLVTIWQLIYKNEGYYIKNNNDLLLMIKKRISLDVETIKSCIDAALERDIFDKVIHNSHDLLTSSGIQKRFFDAAVKKKNVRINPEILLIDVSDYLNLVNDGINPVDSGGNATKEKKIKIKESKEEKEHPEPADEITTLWIKTFGRNPKQPEREETEHLIKKIGYDKAYKAMRSGVLDGCHKLQTLIGQINDQGEYVKFSETDKSRASPAVLTYDEMLQIAHKQGINQGPAMTKHIEKYECIGDGKWQLKINRN